MVFSSTVFLFLFLPLVIIFYYNPIIKNRSFKNIVLLISSLIFYAFGEPVFVFVMLISIIINWFLGIKVEKNKDKKYLIIAYIYNLLLLFSFKYLSFFVQNLGLLFNRSDFALNISLPIGISFFTFQMLSYVIDVYKGNAKVQKNILNVALYVCLFPQLIAGPIVRYETVAEELKNRKENINDFVNGVYRFVYGLGKKVLISNYVGLVADNIFYTIGYQEISVCTAWIGAIAYALQIYFDFSGYSDMAIGLGKIFGFHFDENFNYPYIAKSITDFWKRWHISLSTWFRDYIYIPLGGNRVSNRRHILNLFIVWFFTGMWHGANWTFIIWGIYYFLLLLLEKKTKILNKIGVFSRVYTLGCILIGWVIFRATNITNSAVYIGTMFGINSSGICDSMAIDYLKNTGIIFPIAIILSTPLIKNIYNKIKINRNCKEIVELIVVIVILLFSIFSCVRSTYNPFIYFNF